MTELNWDKFFKCLFLVVFSKVPANTSPNSAIGGKKRENPRAKWWSCSKIHSSMLFVWLGALFSF